MVSASTLLRRSSTAYVLLSLVFAAHCTYVAWRVHFTVPHVDDWRILDDMLSHPLLSWIFTDQNGHRMPVTLFLLAVDYEFFLGKMHLLVATSLLCAWLGVLALRAGLRAGADLDASIVRALLGFGVFSLFWAGGSFDFSWGTNQGSQLGIASLLASLSSLAIYQGRRTDGARRGGASLLGAAAAGAFATTFSHGIGAASWAALDAAAVVARLPLKAIAALVLCTAASVALYGSGLGGVPLGFSVYVQRVMSLELYRFWAAFLGSPLAHAAGGLGLIDASGYFDAGMRAGTAVVAVFAVYLLRLLTRRHRPAPVEVLAAGLMTFPIAGGFLVAVNRVPFPSTAVSERFLGWTVVFWIGAACALAGLLRKQRWTGWIALALLVVLSSAMIPSLRRARLEQALTSYRLAAEGAMHVSSVRWDELAGTLTTPDLVYRVVQSLRRDRRAFFADAWADLPGTRLSDHFTPRADGRCDASLDETQPLAARDGPAVMLSGRVWDRARDEPPWFIVVGDAAGIVRGVGVVATGADPNGIEKDGAWVPAAHWTAFVNESDAARPYTISAVLNGGREICPVGVW